MNVEFGVDLALVIQLLISTVLPIIVALVTKWDTSRPTRALLLALLAAISSGLTELLHTIATDATFDLGVWLVAAIGSFVVAVATHYGLWKPTTVTARALSVGSEPAADRVS